MRFVIPLPPNRANSRGHWRKHHSAKLAYWQYLDGLAITGGWEGFEVPKPPAEPMLSATAAATLYVWSPMDDDNALARMKWPTDWLVTRGYLEDDNREVLRWAAIPDQVTDRKNPRIVLTLEAA